MKKILVTAVALLPALCGAWAYGAEEFSGQVTVEGRSIDVSGEEAKFNEYDDPDSGFTGGLDLNYNAGSGFLNFSSGTIGRDTQTYDFGAGLYDKFTIDLYYKEIPHNLTFDARTFYRGVGSDTLTTTATSASLPTDPTVWPSEFDYSVSRDQYGAGIKLNLLKPFFADFSVTQEDREGIKPAGTYSGISTELPEPVDYKTNTFKAEVGYGEDPFFAALSYVYSRFENDNPYLYFPSLAAANTSEFLSLPPDNSNSKISFKGRVKLPMSSALAVNIGKSESKSDMDLLNAYNTNGSARILSLSDTEFDGEVDTLTYNVVLTSRPLAFADAKLFYSGYEKENKSDEISSSYTTTTTTSEPFDNHLFEYDKKSYGIEAGFKLPARFKLTPYYKNVDVDRHRGDLPETDDDIYGLDVKWTGLDFMMVKVGYERMERDSPWEQLILATGTQSTADAIEPYIRRFDAADQDRDTFTIDVDLTPIDRLNLGLSYRHQKSEYDETVFGLLDKESDGVGLSADLTVTANLTVSAYLDYEVVNIDQMQRNLGTSVTEATAGPIDTTDGDGRYNWTADQEDETFDYGLAVDIRVIPETLTLRAQFDHIRSDGFADYTYFESVPDGYTNSTVDSEEWDDYTRDSFMIKAIYAVNQHLTLTGGYVYEDYEYNDQFYDGYSYVWGATSNNYLTGAGMDPDYTANVFFLSAAYKF